MVKRFLLVGVMIGLAASGSAGQRFSRAGYFDAPGSPRAVHSMNLGWEFSLDGTHWEAAVLPHTPGLVGFEASGGVNYQGRAFYRRRFDWHRRQAKAFLHFEAIMGKADVTVNGHRYPRHFGGFLPIHLDVSEVLRDGENLIEVTADNSDDPAYPPGKPEGLLDFTYFGGIYRDAWLVETGPSFVTDPSEGGVYVTTTLGEDGAWTVRADVVTGGERPDAVELAYDGKDVTSPFRLTDPRLWTPDEPNLHFLTVTVRKGGVMTDRVNVRFGIRDFRITATEGLVLNGRPYRKLIGGNRHQDFLFIGFALPNSLHWRDVKKAKGCGFNVWRTAHYPQDPAFMDACDELGMFAIVPTPGWQFFNSGNPDFAERSFEDVRHMVLRDRTHPSVLMWEPILNETGYPDWYARRTYGIVKENSRAPNYCACDPKPGSEVYDVIYSHPSKAAEVGRGKPTFTREWGDFVDDFCEQNSPSRCMKEWGETAMLVQARHYLDSDTTCVRRLKDTPVSHFGGTMWHTFDHSRGYHPDNFYGGLMTQARQPKTSYWAMKAALTVEPFAYIAHELGPFSPPEMTIFSNCACTVTYDGEPVGPETRFSWTKERALHRGADRYRRAIEVTLPDGSKVLRRPAWRRTGVSIHLDTEGLDPVADGSDMVVAVATLTDDNGTVKTLDSEVIRFSVEGDAEIVGENPQRTRYGEATVLVRYGRNGGPVTVSAALARDPRHVRTVSAELEAVGRAQVDEER